MQKDFQGKTIVTTLILTCSYNSFAQTIRFIAGTTLKKGSEVTRSALHFKVVLAVLNSQVAKLSPAV